MMVFNILDKQNIRTNNQISVKILNLILGNYLINQIIIIHNTKGVKIITAKSKIKTKTIKTIPLNKRILCSLRKKA